LRPRYILLLRLPPRCPPPPPPTPFPYTTLFRSRSCWHTFSPRGKQEATNETRIPALVFPAARLGAWRRGLRPLGRALVAVDHDRSEEHTSELQSRFDLVCRLLLEKKKRNTKTMY